MLINRVKEDNDKRIYEKGDSCDTRDYRAANELLEIMAKNRHRKTIDENALKTRDLVILYENVDLGVKPVSSSKVIENKKPNQYVETIVYRDENDSEDSEDYEIYSNEDLHNVVNINNERIDLLNSMSSFENSLCHKYGNVHIKSSDLTNDYDRHLLFSDPLLKEHLLSLHAMSDPKDYKSTVLPASLLDYICGKRLDDNYGYYMDNIIQYVQHTIEQLKRISNGDYLTEKAKEKWREVNHVYDNNKKTNGNTNTCFEPVNNKLLPIEGIVNKRNNSWNEIVHSEMDVRFLKKILEKEIILEIPKILNGSYRLFPKKMNEAIVISCNKFEMPVKTRNDMKSSVDLFLTHKKSEENFFIKDSSCILALAPTLSIKTVQLKNIENDSEKIKIVEVDDNGNEITQEKVISKNEIKTAQETEDVSLFNKEACYSKTNFILQAFRDPGHSMQEIEIPNTVLEEAEEFSARRKSPSRIRIKSPYENKSHIIEEKRRKRLLEIREKREKKKMAMNENCKITKHKHAKGAIMAQSSNSVTKLSITNKSFYNSIYGQTHGIKSLRYDHQFQKQDNIPDLQINECDEEYSINELSNHEQEKHDQKYINRSYYLDDADTEVMYLQMTPNQTAEETNEFLTPSTSMLSNDINSNELHLTNPSTTDFSYTETSTSFNNYKSEKFIENTNDATLQKNHTETSIQVPSNTPKHENGKYYRNKNHTSSEECIKRIDEIYDLMDTIASSPNLNKSVNNTGINNKNGELVECISNYTVHESNSGVSEKQQLTCNPSSIGYEQTSPNIMAAKINNKNETVTAGASKVILNSKPTGKLESFKTNKEGKKVDTKYTDNPLKAISQLIHNIDNIQKTRHKSGNESKRNYRKSYNSTLEQNAVRRIPNKAEILQEKNVKQNNMESIRLPKATLNPVKNVKLTQLNTTTEKPAMKKKLADIIDEVKEMRGEAVRGPSKGLSRIDSLAKPKKAYVKAQREEHQNRFNRNVIPKVEKSQINPQSVKDNNIRSKYRSRQKIGTDGNISRNTTPVKQLLKTENALDKTVKFTRPASCGPTESYIRLQPAKSTQVIRNTKHFQSDPYEKRMATVETYVKHNFNRLSPTIVQDLKDLAQKSRVPLIPTDLASTASSPLAEESTTLGNKLHDMINSKFPTSLSNLIGNDPNSNTDKERVELLDDCTKDPTDIESISEYTIDIFKDKNVVTAVNCVSKEDSAHTSNYQLQEQCLDNELKQLENALYHQISSGSFQKRLRIKNLTLTPKQSTQQVFVVQSGDDRSIRVKRSLSQKIDFSKTESISKLNVFPIISNDAINWKLPVQIATVGFVFPEYDSLNNNINELLISKKCSKPVNCCKAYNNMQLNDNSDIYNNVAHLEDHNSFQKNNTNKEIEGNKSISGHISTSTSLDILVGLLNEIKRITTCEANFVSRKDKNPDTDCKELKFILNNTTREKNSVSVSSFGELQGVQTSELGLHTSRCTNINEEIFDLKEGAIKRNIKDPRQFITDTSDKAVDVRKSTKEYSDRFTDIPSKIFTTTVNRSTDAINSLIAVVNRYSSESCSFSDCKTIHSNSSLNETKALVPFVPKNKSLLTLNIHKADTEIHSNILTVIYKKEKHNNNIFTRNRIHHNTEVDSALKMKRDVLVTLYSLLVLTVFAALTFPGVLFNT